MISLEIILQLRFLEKTSGQFGKIGFIKNISEEIFFRLLITYFSVKKNRIRTKMSVMYAKHATTSVSVYFGSISTFTGSQVKEKW